MPVRAALFSYFELDDLTRLMNAISGSGIPAAIREHVSGSGTPPMTAMTATTLGTVMLVVGVLVLAWGFPSLPRR